MLPARDGVREVTPSLTAYVERLSSRIFLRAAVVVGSRARNDHWRDSDIDLVVVSDAFSPLTRAQRIEFLLAAWEGDFVLEPFGFTSHEVMEATTVFLWEALADGRTIHDDGIWTRAQERFRSRLESRELERTPHGWRELNLGT